MRNTLIVIPASGNAEYTSLAMDSIRRNTSGALVVIVEADAGTAWEEADDLAVLRLDEFISFSDSVNRGIEFGLALAGEFNYIVLLNNDTAVASGWLPPLQQALDDGFCVAGPVTNSCGHGEQVVHPPFPCVVPNEMNHEAMDRFAGSLDADRTPVFAVVGMCVAFRTELLDRIGMFDRRFAVGNFEDNDWCLRAGELSTKGCCVCRDSFVWHFGSATFRESGDFASVMETNRVRFERKWLGKGNTPKRHGNAVFRAKRLPIALSSVTGSAGPELEAIAVEMGQRGVLISSDGIDIPIDTASVPDHGTDGFYEFCDLVEATAVEASFESQTAEKPDISVCMIVKDEESVLGRCLESLSPLARQLVVVDTGSTDATVAIAKRYGAEVFHHSQEGVFDFSVARNYSLSKAKCKWILVMDADECLLPADVAVVRAVAEHGDAAAHMIVTRLYQTSQKIEGLIHNDGLHPDTSEYCGFVVSTKVRLWPRTACLEFRNEVHETVEQSAAEKKLEFRQCAATVHHFGGRSLEEKDGLYAELGYEKVRSEPCYRTYRELGLQLYRMSRLDEAVSALRKAIEFQPDDTECTVLLAASLSRLSDDSSDEDTASRAEECYLAALEVDRDSELANRYYATFLNQRGRHKEAYWHYKKVAHRAAEAKDIKTLCDFAFVCQNLGQPDEAIELLERAAGVNLDYVRRTGMLECAYHMSGVLAGRSGDMAKAISRFRKALEVNPDFQEASHNLTIAEKWAVADA